MESLQAILIQLFFGLPGMLISVSISVAGWVRMRPWMLVLGGLLAFPSLYYLGAASGLPLLGLPMFQFGLAYVIRKQRPRWSWALLLPIGAALLFMLWIYLYVFLKNNGTL